MKKVLLVIFALISLNVFSQINVKEGSFRKIEGYVMLDKNKHLDDNDNPMALIKITTENISAEERARFRYNGNIETYFDVQQHEDGQTYLYISAKPATFIEIIHPDYGKTEYTFPFDLCDYCGYEMVVQYVPLVPVVTQESSKPKKTYLIVKSDQTDARIYIDDELVNTHEASKAVGVGSTHTYKIECNLYHTESGSVTVNDRTEINKKLRPAFGYINISTSPEQGAKAFVDGDYVGLTPIKTDKIKSGSHTVMVMKDMYKMKERSYNVTDGQTTNATLNMDANFVTITLTVDSGADIYVDEEYKGKGKWTGRLSDGAHIFEARKENHKTSVKTVNLVLGKNETIALDAPTPINGDIDINTTPMGATIYIDGKNYGETPNYISDILIGKHELKLTKQGCSELKKTIVVKEGETLSVNEKLQTYQNTPIGLCVKEGSFRRIDGYVDVEKDKHRDDNDNPMALIMITTENISAEERARFTYKGNAGTYFDVKQQEDGQTYLYLSAEPATFIEIIHPDYGKTEYAFPFELCDFCGYEMVVQYESNCKDQYSNIAGTVEFATNIAFESGKATLTRDSYQYLDQLVQIMRADENCWVKLDGHTDNTYGDNINQQLSLDRAVAIEDYLVENGIGPDRIIARGHGSNKPIADNKTAEGRAKNRRVEVNIAR